MTNKSDMVKIGEVCTVVSGSTPKSNVSEYWRGEFKWITPAELTDDTDTIYETQRMITAAGICSCSLKSFPKGTILLSSRAPIGKVAIAGEEMYCNQGFKNLVCSERIFNRYLYYYLRGKTKYLNSLGRGATFKEISKTIVENILIPLPPMIVQHKMAETLDKISTLMAKRAHQLERLNLMVKSRFVEMFGDIDLNSKSWVVQSLSQHLKVVGGYAFGSDGFSDNGIPVLRIGNINGGYFKPVNLVYWQYGVKLDRYLLFPGDLVISLTGTVGKDDYANVCILGNEYERYYLNQRNAKLELKNTITKEYLAEMLKNPRIKGRLTGISRGVRQANVSNGDIQNLCVPIPPLSLQQCFADFVRQTDKSKFEIQQSLKTLELQYNALMQKYFE